MTHQMARGAQVAFGKSWLERQNIESQTVDVHSHIDGSLSYEENIKKMKRMLGMGGRSTQQATRTMTAGECDVAVGNYEAGYNGTTMKDACECGHPDACEELERKAAKAAAKPKAKQTTTPKAKPKAAPTPKFKTTEDAEQWLEKKYVEYGGRWKFQATPEYKKVHPHLLDLYGKKNRQIEKDRKRVNIIKNPHGTGYAIQFEKTPNTYVSGGGGMMGGMAIFKSAYLAGKEARRLGLIIIPKVMKPPEEGTEVIIAGGAMLGAILGAGHTTRHLKATPKPTPKATPPQTISPAKEEYLRKRDRIDKEQFEKWGIGAPPTPRLPPLTPPAATPKRKPAAAKPAKAPKPKPKAAPKRKAAKKKTAAKPAKAKPQKTAAAAHKLTATQAKRLAATGRVTVKRGGKFVTITR